MQSYQKLLTNTMTKTDRLEILQREINSFTKARKWEQFHTPKNLAMALNVECAELLEIFQWMSPGQSREPDQDTRQHIAEEIGDIMIYLSMIASSFDIDPIEAARNKLVLNEKKYPGPG